MKAVKLSKYDFSDSQSITYEQRGGPTKIILLPSYLDDLGLIQTEL